MDTSLLDGVEQLISTSIIATGTALNTSTGAATRTYQATVTGTGAVSATAVIEVSNNGTNWLTLGTITLSGTTTASDGFVADGAWASTRARVSAISGTGALATAEVGM